MSHKSRFLPCLSIPAALLLTWPSMAKAQPSNADFQQAVAAYQQSPSDETRANVIKVAATLDQLPPIPKEARDHFIMGTTMIKDGKTTDAFKMAIEEFSQAVHLAPWWPEARYNWALAFAAAGQYAAAIDNLRAYQLFRLTEGQTQEAEDKISEIKAKQKMAEHEKALAAQKAAEESSPEAVAEREQQREQALIRSLDGARYIGQSSTSPSLVHDNEFIIRGAMLYWRQRVAWAAPEVATTASSYEWHNMYWTPVQIIGRKARYLLGFNPNIMPVPGSSPVGSVFTISVDGTSITEETHSEPHRTNTYRRQ